MLFFCAQETKPIGRSISDLGRCPHRRVAPIVDIRAHDRDPVGKAHLRGPAELGTNLLDIGPRTIGLTRSFRNMNAAWRPKEADELVDADRPRGAHIVDLARLAALRNREERLDWIRHEREVASLLAIADDRQWLS